MSLFTLGADMAMTPMGERVGASITKARNLKIIVPVCFLIGVIITISKPDLTVLTTQAPSIPNMVLIYAVTAGVGLFLVVSLLRILLGIRLSHLLIGFYILAFILAYFAPNKFMAVAFDSGGVTTGPMTATFVLPFAVGACAAAGGNIVQDAFGVVAMVAMTTLITIQLLGVVYKFKRRKQDRLEALPIAQDIIEENIIDL